MENRREVTYQILRELVSREAGFTPSSSKRSDEQSTRKPEPGSMGSGGE